MPMNPRAGGMRRRRDVRPACGLSLVELMIGIAVGLFVVAAAAMLLSTQLNENRRVLLETQVQQDLRAAADIITRELRRAGHWENAATVVWKPGAAAAINPHRTVWPASAPAGEVGFEYYRRPAEEGPFGFKKEGSVLKTRLGAGGWQELTDSNTLRITRFSVEPVPAPPVSSRLVCPKPCPDGTESCWPTLTVREYQVEIEGEAVSDPAVKRSLRTVVRLRNDLVEFNVPGAPAKVCPD